MMRYLDLGFDVMTHEGEGGGRHGVGWQWRGGHGGSRTVDWVGFRVTMVLLFVLFAPTALLTVAATVGGPRRTVVSLHVFGQVVRSHEPLVADGAGKPFFTCVSSEMSLQLIWTCKSFPTKQPIAHKRSLTRMPSQVSFQMRCFPIHLRMKKQRNYNHHACDLRLVLQAMNS